MGVDLAWWEGIKAKILEGMKRAEEGKKTNLHIFFGRTDHDGTPLPPRVEFQTYD